jgi:phage terminase small subunit
MGTKLTTSLQLTDMARAFAAAYVNHPEAAGNASAAARIAGYSEKTAGQKGYELLRHEGVRAEIERLTREALGDHASAAVALLGRVIRDENVSVKIRVDAAKAVLDRAGFVAPRAPEPTMIGDKPIEAMSIAELEAVARETREYLEREGVLIDVTPAPAVPAEKTAAATE